MEVHDLPVTCIAARPFDAPLQSDEIEDGVRFHVISASADSRLGHLTLQRSAPQPGKPGALKDWFAFFWNLAIKLVIIYFALGRPIWHDFEERCAHEWEKGSFGKIKECLLHEVLIAPSTHPAVLAAPY